GDADAATAGALDARFQLERDVDRDRAPVADEDPRGHGGEAVPGRKEAASFVERGGDEPSMDDPGAALVPPREADGGAVRVYPFGCGERQMQPERIVAAAEAGGIVVRRDRRRIPVSHRLSRHV